MRTKGTAARSNFGKLWRCTEERKVGRPENKRDRGQGFGGAGLKSYDKPGAQEDLVKNGGLKRLTGHPEKREAQ